MIRSACFSILFTSLVWAQPVNQLLDQAYDEILARTPIDLTRLGSKEDLVHWDHLDAEEPGRLSALYRSWAERLRSRQNEPDLDAESKLSLQLFLERAQAEEEGLPFAEYEYLVNQMGGWQSEVPAFFANAQPLTNLGEAENYLARLEGLPKFFQELNQALLRREKAGIIPPRFVFDYALSDIDNILASNPVGQDFESKVRRLKLAPKLEKELLERGRSCIQQSFVPAYQSLRQVLGEQRDRANDQDGCWKFPQGDRYYAWRLQRITTTSLTAEEIHQLGLAEVERIQQEMLGILKQVEFQGSLADFFAFLRRDARFYYPNDQAGKAAYLRDATQLVDKMRSQLDRLFLTKPKAALVVKAVEGYREQSAGKAFYESPALDGSRPGTYYANLYDMSSMPKYQMEALAYHEAIPGHHMQLSIAQELPNLPKFRRLTGYTAYVEGWGLYCELLPKEHGFYRDPYSDFGRLNLELFRAARLVVDTGIHHKRWTRGEALDYYLRNTPNSRSDCQKMVDRHIVMPGQATAYKVGMLEILRLRELAKSRLGQRFDLRKFHDVLLTHGAVPLKVLEQLVEDHIARELSH
jgi:uncharacterized protein (DUF885 family)